MLTAESATSITLLGPDSAAATLLRAEIKDLRSSNASLMPEGLESTLTPQDMANLIALIRSPN